MATAPGWYPDPQEPSTVRWWNGIGWTPWRAESADAEPPPYGGDPRTVATVVPAADREQRHTLRIVLLAVAVVLALLAAVAVMGSAQRRASPLPGSSTSPTAYGSPSVRAAPLVLHPGPRTAELFGELTVQLPGEPAEAPVQGTAGPFADAAASNTEIHPDWYVSAWVGLPQESAVQVTPAATAAAIGESFLSSSYPGTVRAGEPRTGPLGELPADRAASWSVDVELVGVDVPSRTETLQVGAVRLDGGQQVVMLATTTDDTPEDLRAAVEAFWTSPVLA
ncbi:DUF2510 domain-containing protein [Auraticoccus sp. F435]|uniref:DUF2510 domain-containing protein n=1 Tax=Auraticoccus cholistanensis TaxID=2656650 RepID=A0A6A9UPL5_9ACTN|nr:DUF2510 domain-containing protein [Auraticoccus cholistanensis]MVA74826.1 DUF2510 domain-containing protein [Auraticoccus cholistanensis]